MKILLIILLLIIPHFSFAEDIVGFNFGGKLIESEKYEEIEDRVLSHEYIIPDVKFFDYAEVGTDENKIIKTMIFQKNYTFTVNSLRAVKKTIKDDFKKILDTVEKRFGKFDKSNAKNILGKFGETNTFYIGKVAERAVNTSPKSKDIASIILTLESDEDNEFSTGGEKTITFMLMYFDKEFADKMKKKVQEETSGF